MLKMSCAGCPGPSPAILVQFTLKMCVAVENRKKFNPKFKNKTLFWGRGSSRSSMLINLKSLSQILVMMNKICVPICNRYYTRRANSLGSK